MQYIGKELLNVEISKEVRCVPSLITMNNLLLNINAYI